MNQKGFSNTVLILFVAIAIGAVGYFVLVRERTTQQPQATDGKEDIFLTPQYPEEYRIYQDYLRMIGDKPRISDAGAVEATVISITESEACPDIVDPFAPEPKKCSIDPYPKDIGVVRIDKIISYIPYSEQTAEQPIEQPSDAEPLEEGRTTPGYKGRGVELPKAKLLDYQSLQVGQKVPTIFLLTTRLAKVRYVSIPPEPSPSGGLEAKFEEPVTVTHKLGAEQPPKTYKPIPKEGDYFVFTTRIIKYPQTSQKNLPGLRIGSKFRAAIHYDGSLYIGEYELIPSQNKF